MKTKFESQKVNEKLSNSGCYAAVAMTQFASSAGLGDYAAVAMTYFALSAGIGDYDAAVETIRSFNLCRGF